MSACMIVKSSLSVVMDMGAVVSIKGEHRWKYEYSLSRHAQRSNKLANLSRNTWSKHIQILI